MQMSKQLVSEMVANGSRGVITFLCLAVECKFCPDICGCQMKIKSKTVHLHLNYQDDKSIN